MKKIILILFLSFYFVNIQSQVVQKKHIYYFEAEYNYINFNNTPDSYSYDLSNSNGGSFNLKYAYAINKKINFLLGIAFSKNKISSNIGFIVNNNYTDIVLLNDNDYYQNYFVFSQIGIPISLQYNIPANKSNYGIEIGYKYAFLMNDSYNKSNKNGNIIITESYVDNSHLNRNQQIILFRLDIKKQLYNHLGLTFFIHYEQSLSKLFYKERGTDLKYNIFGLGFAISFE